MKKFHNYEFFNKSHNEFHKNKKHKNKNQRIFLIIWIFQILNAGQKIIKSMRQQNEICKTFKISNELAKYSDYRFYRMTKQSINDTLTLKILFTFVQERATRQVSQALTSQIGRVTICPGFFCLLILSRPGLPCLSYAGPTGVRYSIRHLPISAKLWCSQHEHSQINLPCVSFTDRTGFSFLVL